MLKQRYGIIATSYHGGMDAERRKAIQDEFMASEKVSFEPSKDEELVGISQVAEPVSYILHRVWSVLLSLSLWVSIR